MVGKTFKNIKQIENYIKNQISETLQDDVAKEVTQVMVEDGGVIDREVYQQYTPKSYKRTYELKDPINVESKMINDLTLSLKNIRSDGDRYVAKIVETGIGYYTSELDEIIGARPFHEKTKEELEDNKRHVKAMREGLKKRLGNDVVV